MIQEILLEFLAYNIGYFFLRIVTGGKYPKEYLSDGGDIKVEITGILVFLALVIPIFYLFYK